MVDQPRSIEDSLQGKKDLRGTWLQASWALALPIVLVMLVRWLMVEPFVIPSGSMIPNLLVNDHILVQKTSLGIRYPFQKHWLLFWNPPQRGDILVFHYPNQPDVYYIKRVIGLPGDRIEVEGKDLRVNGRAVGRRFLNADERQLHAVPEMADSDSFDYFIESIQPLVPQDGPARTYVVRYDGREDFSDVEEFVVPVGEYFFMGDNRDQSSDSRVWGFVPQDLLVGKAWVIWLSCESMLPSLSYVCDPSQIHWSRLFQSVDLLQ